jgi:hypothetical protein
MLQFWAGLASFYQGGKNWLILAWQKLVFARKVAETNK